MRNHNYGETNGIVIGPELSRIFSEIIFQKIDSNLETLLSKKGFSHGSDFSIFRYVDDYFIFYNEEHIYRKIVADLEFCLNEYKLSLNSEKELIYGKPIITELTIAKQKISNLLGDRISFSVTVTVDRDLRVTRNEYFSVSSKSLITHFKTILKETKVEYKSGFTASAFHGLCICLLV